MVLDIDLFREEKGGDPEKIRVSQRARYQDPASVDKVVDLDKQWRNCQSFLSFFNSYFAFLFVYKARANVNVIFRQIPS